MKIAFAFTKMHGLGNDFVIINNVQKKIDIKALPISTIADRHIGIGCDQILIIEPTEEENNFFCHIFNADGSEAEQCGNGLRCVARYLVHNQISPFTEFSLQTKSGIYPVKVHSDGLVTVMMGSPQIKNKQIELSLANQEIVSLCVLTMGNPHAVMKVDSIQPAQVKALGTVLSAHQYFTCGANIGFMQVHSPHHITLRTFERGAGETLACGSNACAAAVAGIINEWIKSPIQVDFQYGSLFIDWEDAQSAIKMTGPATFVFSGHYS